MKEIKPQSKIMVIHQFISEQFNTIMQNDMSDSQRNPSNLCRMKDAYFDYF